MQRHIQVDGKVRTDKTYPAGFMGMHFYLYFNIHLLSEFEYAIQYFLGMFELLAVLLMFIYFNIHTKVMFLFLLDVVSIPKTNENFRLLYDTKGRFRLHSVRDDEAKVPFIIHVFLLNCFKHAFFFFLIKCLRNYRQDGANFHSHSLYKFQKSHVQSL